MLSSPPITPTPLNGSSTGGGVVTTNFADSPSSLTFHSDDGQAPPVPSSHANHTHHTHHHHHSQMATVHEPSSPPSNNTITNGSLTVPVSSATLSPCSSPQPLQPTLAHHGSAFGPSHHSPSSNPHQIQPLTLSPSHHHHHHHHPHHLHPHHQNALHPLHNNTNNTNNNSNNNNNNNNHNNNNNNNNSNGKLDDNGKKPGQVNGGHTPVTLNSEVDCFGCQMPIRDRYLMAISDGDCYWHESCLKCAACRIHLTQTCYVKEAKFYCKNDYNKLYATKCANCRQLISTKELVMRAGPNAYHIGCFCCSTCGRQLQKGDHYALRGPGRLICAADLHSELVCSPDFHLLPGPEMIYPGGLESLQMNPETALKLEHRHELLEMSAIGGQEYIGSERFPGTPTRTGDSTPGTNSRSSRRSNAASGNGAAGNNVSSAGITGVASAASVSGSCDGSFESKADVTLVGNQNSALPVKQDGRRGPKRPRTILTTAQRRAFKASFEISQKPCRKVREALAKETGLSVRIVQVWFQNQRAKLKKIQRKQQQQQMSQGQNPGSGSGMGMIGNGSESTGGIGSHSSDKSKDDSTDEEDLDDSSSAFPMPGMHYMTGSPEEGSYYSGTRDDDSTVFMKNELIGLDDSETSICDLDPPEQLPELYTGPGSTRLVAPGTPISGIGDHTMFVPSPLICRPPMTQSQPPPHHILSMSALSPHLHPLPHPHHHHHSHHTHHPANGLISGIHPGHLPPPPPPPPTTATTPTLALSPGQTPAGLLGQHQLGPNLTPIDKLYSMQNSYFAPGSAPSECEC